MKQLGILGVLMSLTALGCSDGGINGMGYGGSCGDEVSCEEMAEAEDGGDSCSDETCTEDGTGTGSTEEASQDGSASEDDSEQTDDAADQDTDNPGEETPKLLNCGIDGDTDYGISCDELSTQCSEAGGIFLCKDEKPSEQCQTWGTCSFLKLEAVIIGDEGEEEQTSGSPDMQVQSPIPVEQADVSVFECGDDKMCCLFVPGKGDASADCGGFLTNCGQIGGEKSGGNHAASCQW